MFLYNRADGSEKYLNVCNAIFLLGVSYRLIRLVDYFRTVNKAFSNTTAFHYLLLLFGKYETVATFFCKNPQSIQFAVFFVSRRQHLYFLLSQEKKSTAVFLFYW